MQHRMALASVCENAKLTATNGYDMAKNKLGREVDTCADTLCSHLWSEAKTLDIPTVGKSQ
jgi:hypothetical protein